MAIESSYSYESVLSEFEAAWRAGTAPEIEAYLSQSALEKRAVLLLDLIKIDLEYRWRSIMESRKPADTMVLEDYVNRHPELLIHPLGIVELLGEEYRVRHQWGDQPLRDQYALRFPQVHGALEPHLERVHEELPRMLLTVFQRRELVFSAAVRGAIVLGRQQAGEEPPYGLSQNEQGARVVIAPRAERTISRNCLVLEYRSGKRLRIVNSGKKMIVHANGDLAPSESCEAQLPILIWFSDKAVRLERHLRDDAGY